MGEANKLINVICVIHGDRGVCIQGTLRIHGQKLSSLLGEGSGKTLDKKVTLS